MKKSSNTSSTILTSKPDLPVVGTKIVRLKGGEDLVSVVVETEDGKYILDNPLHLIFKRGDSGMMMVLLPWLPMEVIEENMVTIDKSEVLLLIEPKMKLIDYYNNVLETILKRLVDIEDNVKEYTDEYSEPELSEDVPEDRILH